MSLYLQPLSVPNGTEIPGSAAGIVGLVAQYLSVMGNDGIIGINYGPATPPSDKRGMPWLKTTQSYSPIGFFAWSGSAWTQMPMAMPIGATAARPISPANGTLYFDTDISAALVFDRSKWRTVSGSPGDVKHVKAPSLDQALKRNPGWIEYVDGRDRVIGCAGDGHEYESVIGAEEVTLKKENVPAHSHNVAAPIASNVGGGKLTVGGSGNLGQNIDAVESSSVGDGKPFSVMNPTIYLWAIEKE